MRHRFKSLRRSSGSFNLRTDTPQMNQMPNAEMWTEDLNDDELETSVYRKVDLEIPDCINKYSKALKYSKARVLLEKIFARRQQ